jgi:hypothetical protein
LKIKAGAEFTSGEGIQGTEAGGKLDLGQAALAMQPPEKICRGEIVLDSWRSWLFNPSRALGPVTKKNAPN